MEEIISSIVGVAIGLLLSIIGNIFHGCHYIVLSVFYGILFLSFFIILLFQIKKLQQMVGQVFLISFFLGWAFSNGTFMITKIHEIPFGYYVCLMSLFHYTEFLVSTLVNPETLSLDSFMINHSTLYASAVLCSLTEFLIDKFWFPWINEMSLFTYVGVIMCICGEIIRKGAMLTASKNFTHLLRHEKVEGHELVTHGLYSLCRHPSYAGWYWWAIGTQFVLVNPICLVIYILHLYNFFDERIHYEEMCLFAFFEAKYRDYRKQVTNTGVPFVKGYYSKKFDTK